MHQLFDQLLADRAILLAVSSATVFAIASITSSASPVSTFSEPPGVFGIFSKKIVDQFDHHAMKARPFLVALFV